MSIDNVNPICPAIDCFPPFIMSNTGPSIRPQKRRRTGHKHAPMIEGEDSALTTTMYTTIDDGEQCKKVLVPVRLDEPPARPTPNLQPNPDIPTMGDKIDIDMMDNSQDQPPRRNRWMYMKEFVSRVDSILEAMQDTEAVPDPPSCAACEEGPGHWHCQDCIGGLLVCRKCMRHSHWANPFHRIECWTGTHFRSV